MTFLWLNFREMRGYGGVAWGYGADCAEFCEFNNLA
jgi:hypothetical protein